jgi:sugar lactone lactonase YvrE
MATGLAASTCMAMNATGIRSAMAATLISEISLEIPSNGVSVTPDGRIFLVLARIDGSSGPRVVEWRKGDMIPYPNVKWNDWEAGEDASRYLVHINSQRIGPDGSLWLVDVGAPGIGDELLPGGVKLLKVDIGSNEVVRSYSLAEGTKPNSFVDDVRFNGDMAYLTDAGAPGLIVLDLTTGRQRRVLDNDVSVTARSPIEAEGEIIKDRNGKPVFIHADQLEVSPDGQYLYFQPCCGPMSRLETKYLNDPGIDHQTVASHVSEFVRTPSTGGTAIDAAGNIYLSDTDKLRIMKITPSGDISVFLDDPRLLWVDAMWIDRQQRLWLPAAQLNRLAVFQDGVAKTKPPFHVYTVQLDHGPPAIDHR